ncbi:WWC2 protein, partial [Amia calva]|nr:WWC2 protein [Amia calva]
MSGGQSGFKLKEAKAILSELKSIRKAISSGEKEKQDLMQSVAVLSLPNIRTLQIQSYINTEPDLRHPAGSHLSLSRHTLDAGSQTDISGEAGLRSRSTLAEKVRLSLQYEEAKRSMANVKIELAKLESETWPGALDVEKEKLMLINEKEELLKELQFVTPRQRTPGELERLEAEKQRLEEDLLSVRSTPSQALAERLKVQEKRRELVQKLEESTRLATLLHSQLKSLSASTLSVSSGSSLGSLASSRGSLNTSSRGSLNSLSSTDLYYNPTDQPIDLDYQYKLDLLLQEKPAYIPSGPITTIHEDEVVKSHRGPEDPVPGHPLKPAEPSKSVTSLSSRSSLSSLSPPGSPLVLEGAFSQSAQDSPLHDLSIDFGDCEMAGDFAGLSFYENQMLLDSEPGEKETGEGVRRPLATLHEGASDTDLQRRPAVHLLEEKTGCVSAAVSDESVAGDSGVYEASVKRSVEAEDPVYIEDDPTAYESAQVQIGLKYDASNSSFVVIIMQLRNQSALLVPQGTKVYVRVALLPSSNDISCLFRTKVHCVADSTVFNEVFRVAVSQTVLRHKTLRVDVCTVGKTRQEQCLAGTQISLADHLLSAEISSHWYNLLTCKRASSQKSKEHSEGIAGALTDQHSNLIVDLDAVSALLERTSAELEAVEQELAQEESDGQLEPGEEWLEMLIEDSGEVAVGEEEEEEEEEDPKLAEEVEEQEEEEEQHLFQEEEREDHHESEQEKESKEFEDSSSQICEGPTLSYFVCVCVCVLFLQVDKETNTEDTVPESVAVRPKDRNNLGSRQRSFVRNSMIVRSQTFSPGERSQYICRLNRSDSDSSTLAKKSPFVRNASERRSLRVKRTICQPMVRRPAQDHPVRTSLDLELDLQASRTRQSRLDDELQALRDLRERLETLKARGQTELPPCVLEDERFHRLLKQASQKAEQSKEEQKQGLKAEKLMRKASKDVCRLREQSQKVPLQVQSFR